MLINIGDTAVHAERIQKIQVGEDNHRSCLTVTLEDDSKSQTGILNIDNFSTLEDARKYKDSIVEQVNHYLNGY